ncbi:MAG: hypothetical protein H7A23_23790 [Leptospiraceae bacterium]|nr:hypothetical protein [Leptospiraceae bacterium]
MLFIQVFTILISFFTLLSCRTITNITDSLTKSKQNQKLHLVIDAGSSGTRFCLYEITKNTSNACIAKSLENDYSTCKQIPAENGIAELGSQKGLDVIQNGFDDLNSSNPTYRDQIVQATFIGTGGFRKYPENKYKPILESIDNYFKKEKIPSTTKVITGDEEAEYAWYSAKQIASSTNHGILEIGGATIQIAYKNSPVEESLIKFSEKLGSNVSFDKLSVVGVFNRFCEQPVVSYKDDLFSDCKKFVYNNIFSRSDMKSFVQNNPIPKGTRVYGMGASWFATFNLAKSDKLTIEEIHKIGHEFCGMDQQDIESEYNIPSKYAERVCYTFSYQTALMETLNIAVIYNGKGESYTKGVAISKEFVRFCGKEL